jgi:hypothetical protein
MEYDDEEYSCLTIPQNEYSTNTNVNRNKNGLNQ